MNEKTYPIPGPLLQAIVNYLGSKPFNEVANLIFEIQTVTRQIDNPTIELPKGNGAEDVCR